MVWIATKDKTLINILRVFMNLDAQKKKKKKKSEEGGGGITS